MLLCTSMRAHAYIHTQTERERESQPICITNLNIIQRNSFGMHKEHARVRACVYNIMHSKLFCYSNQCYTSIINLVIFMTIPWMKYWTSHPSTASPSWNYPLERTIDSPFSKFLQYEAIIYHFCTAFYHNQPNNRLKLFYPHDHLAVFLCQ